MGKPQKFKYLAKRELILGTCAYLALVGLLNIGPGNGSPLILIVPLIADCSTAFVDEDYRQAFHDRVSGTIVIPTRRGYSLDLKVKKLLDRVSNYMRR